MRVGIHPDDPPGLTLGGVPRPIFSSFDGVSIADHIPQMAGDDLHPAAPDFAFGHDLRAPNTHRHRARAQKACGARVLPARATRVGSVACIDAAVPPP